MQYKNIYTLYEKGVSEKFQPRIRGGGSLFIRKEGGFKHLSEKGRVFEVFCGSPPKKASCL